MFKTKVALRDIAKIEKSQIFVLFENEALYDDFFLPISVLSHVTDTFQSKFDLKEAQGYKSNILLLLYQYVFIDVFFRKSITEIWQINP